MVTGHVWAVKIGVVVGITACVVYAGVVMRTPHSYTVQYGSHVLTDASCNAIDAWVQSHYTNSPSVFTQELLETFPAVFSVQATMLPTRTLWVELQPHCPRYCINTDALVCDGGFIVPKAHYLPRVYESFACVSMPEPLPEKFSVSMYQNMCAMLSWCKNDYTVVWKSDTAIWLYAKKHRDFAVVLALELLNNGTLTKQIDTVAMQLMNENVKKSPSKDKFRVLDARFADQLVMYTTQGGRG